MSSAGLNPFADVESNSSIETDDCSLKTGSVIRGTCLYFVCMGNVTMGIRFSGLREGYFSSQTINSTPPLGLQ